LQLLDGLLACLHLTLLRLDDALAAAGQLLFPFALAGARFIHAVARRRLDFSCPGLSVRICSLGQLRGLKGSPREGEMK